MFDLDKHKCVIAEHYFRALHHFALRSGDPSAQQAFIKKWLDLLCDYSRNSPGFVCFEPKIPVLRRLVPRAKGVLVVPFENTRTWFDFSPHVSVLSLYPYKVLTEHRHFCCREGFEFLKDYLQLTGIRVICFHSQVHHYLQLSEDLRRLFPDLNVYGPRSIRTFGEYIRHLPA